MFIVELVFPLYNLNNVD